MPNKRVASKVKPKSNTNKAKPRRNQNYGSQRYLPTSTTNQVQTKLSKTIPRSIGIANSYYGMYAKCRLDPFNSMGSNGVPDSCSLRTVVVDHRGYCDIQIGSAGTCVLKTLPAFPYGLLAKTGSTTGSLGINGVNYTQGATGVNYNLDWIPAITYSEYIPQAAAAYGGTPIPPIGDPFIAARYRIVTQAFRIYYTGQANVCSGIVTISSDSLSTDLASSMSQSAITLYSYTAGAQSGITLASGNYMCKRVSEGTVPGTLTPSSVNLRPETGANILIKHTAPEYDFVPMSEYGTVLVPSAQAGYSYIAQVLGATTYNPIVMGIDPGWESVIVSITGATNGSTFRVESVMCVEYEPLPSSNVVRFAKSNPHSNATIVAGIDKISKSIPVAIPLSQSMQPWLTQVAKFIGAIAPTVGGLFGPAGAVIGAAAGKALDNMVS